MAADIRSARRRSLNEGGLKVFPNHSASLQVGQQIVIPTIHFQQKACFPGNFNTTRSPSQKKFRVQRVPATLVRALAAAGRLPSW
jgi:hypothetical protein